MSAARETASTGPGWFWTQDEWAEWSNELAMLIPTDDESRYSNPDGAQESVIADCLRTYVAQIERVEAALAELALLPQGVVIDVAEEVVAPIRAALAGDAS